MLAPLTPHLAEELWHQQGEEGSVHVAAWPAYDPQLIQDDIVTIVVQVAGKVRANVLAAPDATPEELITLAQADPNVQRHLEGKTILKTITVPRKLVNFVVK
jgi:leucyl-tRNA synthetase